ncbi:MAG: S-layer homology domain-containing protein [Anaerovoracaceae bacterium]
MMSICRRFLAAALAGVMALIPAVVTAKTNPNGQTVSNVLFYVENADGDRVLVSQIPVSRMEQDLEEGRISDEVHNYSLLDRYVTTVHQEAQGFTVDEFVSYAKGLSSAENLKDAKLSFAGEDRISFWEIDQTGFDEMDTYSYDELYGVPRYNFPLLYKYWNYKTQEYYDPDGVMSAGEVMDYIFENGQPEIFLLSVRAFSERYMVSEKYGTGDYNMENLFSSSGLLDSQRTIRMMKPMTRQELENAVPTASDSRYWCARILLDMAQAPDIKPLGRVAAPAASMTEDEDNYYITFTTATEGASIYYNANFQSPGYAPAALYDGGTVTVPKSAFPGGEVTMTAQAVKDGWTDEGVVTLKLRAGESTGGAPEGTGTTQQPGVSDGTGTTDQPGTSERTFTDVRAEDWYHDAVAFVTEKGYFSGTGNGRFSPSENMTRGMFVTVLGRMAGADVSSYAAGAFSDVPQGRYYTGYVAWASENGIVSGVGGGRFDPDGRVTREQMAVILYNYAVFSGEGTEADASGNYVLEGFSDAASVSSWAENGVSWAASRGILKGSAGILNPGGPATRAQVAQMIMNYTV